MQKSFANEDIRKPVIEMFAKSVDFFEALPFEGLKAPVFRVLPAGSAADARSSAASTKILDPADTAPSRRCRKRPAIIDHDIDVDRAIVDRHGPERRNYEEQMGITSFGQLWATTLIKGDQSTNPRVFNGLQIRCAKYSRDMHNSAASGGAALSLANLDKAINAVNKPTHILAPYASRPLWIQAARNTTLSGFVMQTWDGVGTLKMSYAGLPFMWGYPKDDHPPMLDFTEVASGGGSAVTASLYIASVGEGKLRGLQVRPIEARDIGLLQDGKTFRTHLSWDVGMVDEHKFCLARLDSWTNAPIVT